MTVVTRQKYWKRISISKGVVCKCVPSKIHHLLGQGKKFKWALKLFNKIEIHKVVLHTWVTLEYHQRKGRKWPPAGNRVIGRVKWRHGERFWESAWQCSCSHSHAWNFSWDGRMSLGCLHPWNFHQGNQYSEIEVLNPMIIPTTYVV